MLKNAPEIERGNFLGGAISDSAITSIYDHRVNSRDSTSGSWPQQEAARRGKDQYLLLARLA